MILIDTGPLVALLDSSDRHHEACRRAIRQIRRERVVTSWPVLTETCHLLLREAIPVAGLFGMLLSGPIEVLELRPTDLPQIEKLMDTYRNRSMDLADASLVRLAEREGVHRIFTIDRDAFSTYRAQGIAGFELLP